jgi:ribosomal protein S18 acetylase RimI-like enzyme
MAGGPETGTGTGIDATRVEEAGLNALQTQRQLFYDGWLLRLSPGKAKRARSVNAHFGSTLPLAAKIAHCEALYARHALPALFRITPFVRPPDLDAALAGRGYEAFDETLAMAASLAAAPAIAPPAPGITLADVEATAFVDIVGDLRGSPAPQREAHRERLLNSPLANRMLVVRAGGDIACAAQVAIDGDLAGIYDVVTADEARGQGHATLACAALLSWAARQGARVAYLQVDSHNTPALAVYRKFGFATAYTYHYRARPGECR